jgi:hypothetical protein
LRTPARHGGRFGRRRSRPARSRQAEREQIHDHNGVAVVIDVFVGSFLGTVQARSRMLGWDLRAATRVSAAAQNLPAAWKRAAEGGVAGLESRSGFFWIRVPSLPLRVQCRESPVSIVVSRPCKSRDLTCERRLDSELGSA